MIKSSLNEEDSFLPSYKIIIVGLAATGKTKLLTRYRYGTYQDTREATPMVDYTLVQRNNAKFGYFDTAGQEKYRSILTMYFKETDAALLIYTVDDHHSLSELAYYQEQLALHAPLCRVYLVATKCDLQRKVARGEAEQLIRPVRHFETSAKLNQGVTEAFSTIEKDLLAIPKKRVDRFSIVVQYDPKAKQKAKCCLTQ